MFPPTVSILKNVLTPHFKNLGPIKLDSPPHLHHIFSKSSDRPCQSLNSISRGFGGRCPHLTVVLILICSVHMIISFQRTSSFFYFTVISFDMTRYDGDSTYGS